MIEVSTTGGAQSDRCVLTMISRNTVKPLPVYVVHIIVVFVKAKFSGLTCKPTGIGNQILSIHAFDTDRQRVGNVSKDREEEQGRREAFASRFKVFD